MKKSKAKIVFKYLLLALSVLEMLLLCVESVLPGNVSSQHSGAVGDIIDDVFTDLSGDESRDVPPDSFRILIDEEECLSLALPIGSKAQLQTEIMPQNTSVNHRKVEWRSSNEEVATVRAGKITACGLGDAVITASLAEDEITREVQLSVSEIVAESLSLTFADGSKSAAVQAGDSLLLSAALTPEDATAPITFSSENDEIAAVDQNGVVHALAAGRTAIFAKYVPFAGGETELTDRVELEVAEGVAPLPPEDIAIELPDGMQHGIVYVGDEGTISAAPMPASDSSDLLIFTSSDEEVLSIDALSGAFTANKKGRAVVTVYSAAFPEIASSVTIEVRNETLGASIASGRTDLPLSATETVNEYSLSLPAGTWLPLMISATPEEYFVRFATSDAETAEISESAIILPYRANDDGAVLTAEVSDNEAFSSEQGLVETFTLRLVVSKQSFSSGVSGWGTLIRKLFGHFGAFLLLGVLLGTTAILFDKGSWKRRVVVLLLLVLVGFAFAGLTEILQLDVFTSGRGSSFRDVLIDFSGYLPAMLAVYGGFLLISLIVQTVRKRKQTQ